MAITKLVADSITSGAIANTPAFSAIPSGSQTITSGVDTLLNCATEIFDTDGAYDGTNKFTIPSGQDGKYFFNANLSMDSMYSTDIIIGTLAKNGTLDQTVRTRVIMAKDNATITFNISGIVSAVAGDYFQVYLSQNRGSDRTTNNTRSAFRGFKLI